MQSPMQTMLKECGVFNTQQHFQPIKHYHQQHLPNTTEFLAYKAFTPTSTHMATLTKNGGQYTLTASLPNVRNGSISKLVDPPSALQAISDVHAASGADNQNLTANFHPRCLLAGIKTTEQHHNVWVNNYSLTTAPHTSNHKAMRTYGVLNNLLNQYLPNHHEQLNSIWENQPGIEIIKGKKVLPIKEPEPTTKAIKAYRKQLEQQPFAEISLTH